jgi:hypothetical protein
MRRRQLCLALEQSAPPHEQTSPRSSRVGSAARTLSVSERRVAKKPFPAGTLHGLAREEHDVAQPLLAFGSKTSSKYASNPQKCQ